MKTSTVYLLHFEPPYRAPIGDTGRVKIAGHYLGSTALAADARLAEHIAGRGSPLIRAAIAAGCVVSIVRTWPGDRQLERRFKRAHNHGRLCPVCRHRHASKRLRSERPLGIL